jgi:hypothetical protein
MRTLLLLSIIIAMNYTVTQLKTMLFHSPWVPSTPLHVRAYVHCVNRCDFNHILCDKKLMIYIVSCFNLTRWDYYLNLHFKAVFMYFYFNFLSLSLFFSLYFSLFIYIFFSCFLVCPLQAVSGSALGVHPLSSSSHCLSDHSGTSSIALLLCHRRALSMVIVLDVLLLKYIFLL